MNAIEFLRRAADSESRIVCSGDLTAKQIAESQAKKQWYVDSETRYGFALLAWDLTTTKDRQREKRYFQRNFVAVED